MGKKRGFQSTLPAREVQALIHNMKKRISIQCTDAPLKNHCNSAVCKELKYGIDSVDYLPTIDSFQVLKTKPPIYFLTIDKKTVELTGKQLNQQQLYLNNCLIKQILFGKKLKTKIMSF